jgi:DNA polymerase-1
MLEQFAQAWSIDFEFESSPGERPTPVSFVAHEWRSGRTIWMFIGHDLRPGVPPPIEFESPSVLIVTWFGSAEFGCFKALGWPKPKYTIDLYYEYRRLLSGLEKPAYGYGLPGALTHFGLETMDAAAKDEIRTAIGDGTWRNKYSRQEVLEYNQQDVIATEQVLMRIQQHWGRFPFVLRRGRYAPTVADMEWNGIPIDMERLNPLRADWECIKEQLIAEINPEYGVYEGTEWRDEKFEWYLRRNGMSWPRTEGGRLETKKETFRDMETIYPQIAKLRELKNTLSEIKMNQLAVGSDGRNRTLLSPFASKTGRNQPSNSKFIFGPARWLRFLIKPGPGMAVATSDWEAQELGIAAALSGDRNLIEAYNTGDPYMAFAIQAGGAPQDATKKTNPKERSMFKQTMLAVQYGQTPHGMAGRTGMHPVECAELLQKHKRLYQRFWEWDGNAVNFANLNGYLPTRFDWRINLPPNGVKVRTLMNWPMQSHGSEMLRLACCLATERGLKIIAPIHDALMIEAPAGELLEHIRQLHECMLEASREVLGGFEVRAECKIPVNHGDESDIAIYPDRFRDSKSDGVMWARLMRMLGLEP